MHNNEAVEMMQCARDEIKSLRARINTLEPKANAYDSICTILGLLPQKAQGYGEDVAWMLEKRIGEIKKEMEAERAEIRAGASKPADQGAEVAK